MADPLSVLANAGALVHLITCAYETIEAFTRSRPNCELDELACEVRNLGTACDIVHGQFNELGSDPAPDGLVDQRLVAALDSVVADCKGTLARLDDVVNNIRGRRSSFERSIRLIRNRDGIVDLRRKVHSHTLALQLISQSLNINVSWIAPRIADQALLTEIENLKQLISRSIESTETHQPGQAEPDQQPAENVVEYARETATRGQTLYDSSVAASSLCGGDATHTRLAWVTDWLMNDSRMRSLSYSTTASFNPPAPSTGGGSDRAPDTDPSTSPELLRGGIERGPTRLTIDNPEQRLDQDFSGDIIELEMLQRTKAASEEAFSAFEFQTAKERLLECLAIIARLPSHHRASIDEVWEVKYKLAICSFQVDEAIDVERTLQEALQYTASADAQRRKVFHANHLLAQLYACTGRLELAFQACSNTLRGRKSLLGSQNHEYFCSLALTSRILELQNDSVLAGVYLREIPELHQATYSRAYKNMLCSDEVVFKTTMDILPEMSALDEHEGLAVGEALGANAHATAASNSSHSERSPNGQTTHATPNASPTERHPFSSSAFTSTIADRSWRPTSWRPTSWRPTSWQGSHADINRPSLVTQAHDRERWLQILGICPSNGLQPSTALDCLEDATTSLRLGYCPKNSRLDAQGLTALHLAALFGDLDLVSSLVSASASINATYKPLEANEYFFESARPIELAVAARKVDVVRKLVENGASYNDCSGRSNLPLWLMHSRWLEVTNCRHSGEIIDILEILHEFAHIKTNDDLASGTFMLHRALRTAGYFVALDWLDIIRYLRSKGANRVALGAYGLMPIHIACTYHHNTEILTFLLDWSNDDVNLLSGDDYPLGLALQNKNADSGVRYEMATLLLEHGANVIPVDREGKSAKQLVHLLTPDHQNAFEAFLSRYR